MPSNNSKYSEEMRNQTASYIIENGKSATKVSEELGLDKNTVCRWVRDYRRKHNMPSYEEEKGIKAKPPKDNRELTNRIKELEKQIKEKRQGNRKTKEKGRRREGKCRDTKKIPAHLHATTRMKYEAIEANSSTFEVKRMCKILELKAPNYYRWKKQKRRNMKK